MDQTPKACFPQDPGIVRAKVILSRRQMPNEYNRRASGVFKVQFMVLKFSNHRKVVLCEVVLELRGVQPVALIS